MRRPGRNQPCHCGSGTKYKNCCEAKDARGTSNGLKLLFGGLVLIAAIGVVASLRNDKRPERLSARVAPIQNNPMHPGAPQPPGPVPEGKEWNVEHGHWHDKAHQIQAPIQIDQNGKPVIVTGGQQPITVTPGAPPQQQQQQPQFTPAPQPPGPVPAGKVWSVEHGHWHDLPKQ